MTDLGDRLVSDYLAQVEAASSMLPVSRRNELLRDLGEHISAARAEMLSESEVEVRNLLDRLGRPERIAEAAAADTVSPAAPPGRSSRRTFLWVALACLMIIALVLVAFFAASGEGGASGT